VAGAHGFADDGACGSVVAQSGADSGEQAGLPFVWTGFVAKFGPFVTPGVGPPDESERVALEFDELFF
jgi:hypothetical protein